MKLEVLGYELDKEQLKAALKNDINTMIIAGAGTGKSTTMVGKIKYLVLHPGSHVGLGIDKGINNIIKALNIVNKQNDSVVILLETMAGKGTEIGSNFFELKKIIDGVEDKSKIGICLDTCHLNDSGYDIENFDSLLDEFNQIIGIDYIRCVHINDSKNISGSKKDRH